MVNGVQHAPQDLTFEHKCLDGSLLLLARMAVLDDNLNCVLSIVRRLRQACLEICQAMSVNPRIVTLESLVLYIRSGANHSVSEAAMASIQGCAFANVT
jgi:hypothetical protein